MASHIRIEADADDAVSKADVYDALRGIDPADLSTQSPVSNQLPEAFVAIGAGGIAVKVDGHEGEWSRSTEQAVTRTLAGIDGVDAQSVSVVAGGFESDAVEQDDEAGDAGTDDEGDEDAEGVETITGVGPGRADTLRAAGIQTVDDVLDVGVDGLVAAGIPEGVAENIVEQA